MVTGPALQVLARLPADYVQTVITSPPYWSLRDYAIPGQIGLEATVQAYIAALVAVFAEVRRVLRPDGTLWLNIGDSYTSGGRTWRAPDKKNPARAMTTRPPTPDGLKPKELTGIPWRLAFALQDAGWYLRSDIIWRKPNAQPESVKDRPTRSHEYLFFLTKSERYYYDPQTVREQNDRQLRDVWDINTYPLPDVHFATFPPKLVEPCLLLASRPGDVVLDPFLGSGTTGVVAVEWGRPFLGIELNPAYVDIARRRLRQLTRLDRWMEEVEDYPAAPMQEVS
ncbi:MAG TPA: site-specific DNA-methyltransferase [Chloroflexia bacterium]|nr:site-specific DNA-methyltransferase [Chloroflexia bacterium]